MRHFLSLLPFLLLAACASQQRSGFLGEGRAPVLVANNESQNAEDPVREGCAYEQGMVDADFGFVHSLANGMKLYVCGRKGMSQGIFGHLFVRLPGEASAEESHVFVGGLSESFAPFSTELVRVERDKDGLDLLDLIPWSAHEQIPALKRRLRCDERGCKELEPVCVFQKPEGRVNTKAFESLRKDWNAEIDLSGADQAEEAVKELGGGRNSHQDSAGQLTFEVYRNALLGHKPSLALLLNEKLIKKLNERYKDEVGELGGFAHNVVHRTLSRLRKYHCL
jgi:hypothetical protein